MPSLLEKLQFKAQPSILISRAPEEFASQLAEIKQTVKVYTRSLGDQRHAMALFFVRDRADLAARVPSAVAAVERDGALWFAYPKKSSKRYPSDIGRDDSWQALGDLGFEGVRMISIDEDWSALRLRRVDFIQSMKRSPKRAMSAQGKRRLRR